MRSVPQRVMVINSGSVFDSSMVHLLMQARDLEVIEVTYREPVSFLSTVTYFKPHVIVVNDSDQTNAAHILEVLRASRPINRLRVIVIRIQDNTLEQHEIRQVVATDSADLVALIRNE